MIGIEADARLTINNIQNLKHHAAVVAYSRLVRWQVLNRKPQPEPTRALEQAVDAAQALAASQSALRLIFSEQARVNDDAFRLKRVRHLAGPAHFAHRSSPLQFIWRAEVYFAPKRRMNRPGGHPHSGQIVVQLSGISILCVLCGGGKQHFNMRDAAPDGLFELLTSKIGADHRAADAEGSAHVA